MTENAVAERNETGAEVALRNPSTTMALIIALSEFERAKRNNQ